MTRNDRGIALLIVLLVTALLIALVFEFAYATRISLNSAVNFRDSQRAYFLALSGSMPSKSNGQKLREIIPQGEWQPVPLIARDTQVMVKWEDESGKIKINDVEDDNGQLRAWSRTFLKTRASTPTCIDRMMDQRSNVITVHALVRTSCSI